MALRAIKPKYIDWMTNNKDIENLIDNLKDEISELNTDILNATKSDKNIEETIIDVRKKLLYTNLLLNDNILDNTNKDWSEQKQIMAKLSVNMSYIDKYEERNLAVNQKKNIDIIAWFGVIFLPLTFITGYYGMNFASMGSPSTKSGPFSWKYGQLWVFVLFLISIILTILILKKYYK